MAKYWQYRENFQKHFIVMDRDSSGCINDGIGQDTSNPCNFAKSGFGLPATSIWLTRNGRVGLGHRIDSAFVNHNIYDTDCMGETSLTDGSDPNHRFNFLDMGAETLTQSGFYLMTLATEYEMLGKNGQHAEQQKTLENIFLVLQSIRRLDMQTQCLLKEMYDNRIPLSGDSCYICDEPYTETGGFGHFGGGAIHYDECVNDDCVFEPDFTGYNGFFVREDATQNLENYLHDPTDDTYNIDGVGGAFAVSTNDISDCKKVDRFCYMANTQNFFSQDQITNLLLGWVRLQFDVI